MDSELLKKGIRFLFFLLIAFLVFLYVVFDGSSYMDISNIHKVRNFLLAGFNRYLVIFILFLFYVFGSIFGFPTMYFSILLGYLYGVMTGFLIAWFGMCAGIGLSFFNSRYLFRDWFYDKFGTNPVVSKITRSVHEKSFLPPLLTRIVFVIPYNIQNYAYGLTSINPFIYLIASGIGIIPVTLINVSLGSALNSF